MALKCKFFYTMLLCMACVFIVGCAMFRYSIIPQEKVGPHGGALTFIDQRISDYVEFVAIPNETEWTFQVYVYDKNMKQRHICGSGYLMVVLPDGIKKGVELWNTKPYFWSKGEGHLENKIQISNAREFIAYVSILRGRSADRLTFKYPYNQKGNRENEKN